MVEITSARWWSWSDRVGDRMLRNEYAVFIVQESSGLERFCWKGRREMAR